MHLAFTCCKRNKLILRFQIVIITLFELQTELEECTETLSEMIARPYLRTPRSKIIQTAHLVQRKRHEFVVAIAKGLVPPDSSPNMKRRRRKYSVELDVCFSLIYIYHAVVEIYYMYLSCVKESNCSCFV